MAGMMASTSTGGAGWWRGYDSTPTGQGRRYSRDTIGSPRGERRPRASSLTVSSLSSSYSPSTSYVNSRTYTPSSPSPSYSNRKEINNHVTSMDNPSGQAWRSSSPSLLSPRNTRKPPPSPSMSTRSEVPSYDKYYWNTSKTATKVPTVLKIYHRVSDSNSPYATSTLPRDRYSRRPPTGISKRESSPSASSLQDVRATRDPSPSHRTSLEVSPSNQHAPDHTASDAPLRRSLNSPLSGNNLPQTPPVPPERSDSKENGYRRGMGTPVLYRRRVPDEKDNSQSWDGGLRRTLHRSSDDLRTITQKPFSRGNTSLDNFKALVRDSTEDLRGVRRYQISKSVDIPSSDVRETRSTESTAIPSTNVDDKPDKGGDALQNGASLGDFTTVSTRSPTKQTPTTVTRLQSKPPLQQAPPSNEMVKEDLVPTYEEHTITTLDYTAELVNKPRERSHSTPVLPSPILKKVSQFARGGFSRPRRPPLKKQTSFKEDVKIVHYDDEENMSTTGSGPLREERDYSRQDGKASSGEVFTTELETSVRSVSTEKMMGSESKAGSVEAHSGQRKHDDMDLLIEEAKKYAQSPVSRCSTGPMAGDSTSSRHETATLAGSIASIFHSKNLEFLPGTVGSGGSQKQSRIRLLLRLGQGFIHSQTTVKALSGGLNLIVVTYRSSLASDGSIRLHQYREKLALPVKVDPYSMRAFMQKTGELHIEANVAAD